MPTTTNHRRGTTAARSTMESDTAASDPIEYEMDVFLAPELAPSLNLLQYPTHHHAVSLPETARIKPRHGLLETDSYHATLDGGAALRTYTSQTIPITTHLCIGKVVPGGTSIRLVDSIHLVPIARIQQMRPSFRHLETAAEGSGGGGTTHGGSGGTNQAEESNRPVTFQRKESDRAAAARKSSYQFKKRSEDGEDWCELQVVTNDGGGTTTNNKNNNIDDDVDMIGLPEIVSSSTLNRDVYLQRTYCLDLENNLFAPADDDTASRGGHGHSNNNNNNNNRSYIQSLNYVGNTDHNDASGSEYDKAMSREEALANPQAALLHLLRHMLRSGAPIPYSAIRRRVHADFFDNGRTVGGNDDDDDNNNNDHDGQPGRRIDDAMVFDALRDCAVLCRGNWCLLSKFCIDLPDRLKRLRTFVLLLLEEDATVHRDRLLATCEQLHDSLTRDQVKTVLTMVAKRVSGGWVPKIDDDNQFIVDHREVCKTHRANWQRQQERFAEELRTYRQLTTTSSLAEQQPCVRRLS